MSSVRYLADYTFHFRQAKVRQLLRSAGIGIAAQKPQLNPLLSCRFIALGIISSCGTIRTLGAMHGGRFRSRSGPTKLALPLGGVGDLTAINAEQARSGDAQALAEIAQRNNADEALVAAATRQQGDHLTGLDITLKRYRLGHLLVSRTEAIDVIPAKAQ